MGHDWATRDRSHPILTVSHCIVGYEGSEFVGGHANPRTDVSRLTPLCGNPQRAGLAGILSHTAPLTRGIPVTRSPYGTPG